MFRNRFLLVTVFGVLFYLLGCSSKNPLNAPELKGESLEDFLNSPIKYGPVFHNDYVKDIFYSSDVAEDANVLPPKNLGTKKGIKNIAIIIEKGGNNTILYFEGKKGFPNSSVYKYTFTKLEKGELVRYQNKMNPILAEIFPSEYFRRIALEIEDYEQGEPERKEEQKKRLEEAVASFRTPEGWPKDSIYTSLLLLRKGILDFKDYTVGQVFYTGNRLEGITVAEPRSSGRFQVISVTSSLNSSARFDLYLFYDKKSQTSLLEKVEAKDGNKSTVATTFEEKYAVLLMLLPLLINEGNLGE
jgi:hypothetical protein